MTNHHKPSIWDWFTAGAPGGHWLIIRHCFSWISSQLVPGGQVISAHRMWGGLPHCWWKSNHGGSDNTKNHQQWIWFQYLIRVFLKIGGTTKSSILKQCFVVNQPYTLYTKNMGRLAVMANITIVKRLIKQHTIGGYRSLSLSPNFTSKSETWLASQSPRPTYLTTHDDRFSAGALWIHLIYYIHTVVDDQPFWSIIDNRSSSSSSSFNGWPLSPVSDRDHTTRKTHGGRAAWIIIVDLINMLMLDPF